MKKQRTSCLGGIPNGCKKTGYYRDVGGTGPMFCTCRIGQKLEKRWLRSIDKNDKTN